MSEQENIYNLPLFKAHVLLFADLVADFSGKTELAENEKLREVFLRKLSTVKSPTADEIKAAAELTTDDVLQRALERREQQSFEVQMTPEGKVDLYEAEHPNLRPNRKALSRREMLRSLVHGDIHPADLKSDEELDTELPGYFDSVKKVALEADLGLMSLTAPDGKEYLYFKPLLSNSYARLLSVKDDSEALISDQVRENSRVYPRPVPTQMFLQTPFNFKSEQLAELLDTMGEKEEYNDIKVTRTSGGTLFLYSDKYLEDDYADFLAEEQERRPFNP